MKHILRLGLLLSFSYVWGQVTRDLPGPSITDILRDTGILDAGVIDLTTLQSFNDGSTQDGVRAGNSDAPQVDRASDVFANHGASNRESTGHAHAHGHDELHGNTPNDGPLVLTDAQGNLPPVPTGIHVDLPGEHGNTNDFPVIHHGEAPVLASTVISLNAENGVANPGHHDNHLSKSGDLLGAENALPVPLESAHGPDTVSLNPQHIDHSSNPFHATNVHQIVPGSKSNSRNFDDLSSIGNIGLGLAGNGQPPALTHIPLDTPVSTNDHSSVPHIPAAPDDQVNHVDPSNSASTTDGFLSPSEGSVPFPNGIHGDIPNIVALSNPPLSGNVHVSLPGKHDNPIVGVPVGHRENGAPNSWNPMGDVHADMPDMSSEQGNPILGQPIDSTNTQHQSGTPVVNVHIDLPGQHGNPLDGHPVVHREGPTAHVPPSGTPLASEHPGLPTGTPISNVHIDLPGQHGNPLNGHPVVHREVPTGIRPQTGTPLVSGNTGLPVGTPVGNTHVDMPGQHGNPLDSHPVDHREGTNVPGHNDLTGIHIDPPGVHGNMLNEPALHLPPGATIQDAIAAGIIPDPSAPEPGSQPPVDTTNIGPQHLTGVGSIHVDLPGQHGNPLDGHPVVHREGPSGLVPQTMVPSGFPSETPVRNTHVDMPGNPPDSHPIVHRDETHEPNLAVPIPTGSSSGGPRDHLQQDLSGIHIDPPGVHGNMLNEPALHLPPGANIQDAIDAGIIPDPSAPRPDSLTPIETKDIRPVSSIGNVHIDLPGQHGNPLDGHPVVHREGPATLVPHTGTPLVSGNSGLPVGIPNSNVHVDMPGEHGNPLDSHPVVHRERPIGAVPQTVTPLVSGNPGISVGTPISNVHVDMPGEHGNPLDGHPVVHREGPHGFEPQTGVSVGTGGFGTPLGTPAVGVHVDMPGQHGNPLDGHPVVHREGPQGVGHHVSPFNSNNVVPLPGIPLGNVHVDMPGKHSNPIAGHPVVHREDNQHGQHFGSVLGNVGVFGPVMATGVLQGTINNIDLSRKPKRLSPIAGIDVHGKHGSPIGKLPEIHSDVPVVGTIVPTGVLPGTINVPVAPKKSGSNGLLDGPKVRYPDSRGASNLERTNFGIVDDDSVLLTNSWRGRDKRRRGGRRRGRGRGGRRWRTTTTTTTPSPENSGNGITVIRTSRPNPLAALGDALRSALNINSGSGGLLGSLIRSAAAARTGGIRVQPIGGGIIGGLLGGKR